MHISSSSSSDRVGTPNSSDYDDDDVSVDSNEATSNWREGRAETPDKKERQPKRALSTAKKIVNVEKNDEQKKEAFFSGVSPGKIAAGALSLTVLAGGLATIIVGGMGTLQVPEHDRPLDIGLISAGGIATIVGAISFLCCCSQPDNPSFSQTVVTAIPNLA